MVPAFTSETSRSLLAMRSLSVTAAQFLYRGFEKPVVPGKWNVTVVELLVDAIDDILRQTNGHGHSR